MYSTATNVEIELPVPADSTNPNVRTSMGSAAYAPESDALVWKIKSFPGNKVGILYVSLLHALTVFILVRVSFFVHFVGVGVYVEG